MEENKSCSHGDCEKCKDSKMGMCCGHKCCGGKCHMILKILIPIIILIIVFCLGAMVGSHRDGFRGYDEGQRFLKNKSYDSGTGSITVKVLPDTTVTE